MRSALLAALAAAAAAAAGELLRLGPFAQGANRKCVLRSALTDSPRIS